MMNYNQSLMHHWLYLMVGMLCRGPVLSSNTRWERYWLRSPHSMYSVTMHRGSLLTHTPSKRIMLGSFRRDKIFTSFRKSFLHDDTQGEVTTTAEHIAYTPHTQCYFVLESRVSEKAGASNLAFFEASGLRIFTATNRGRPFLTLKGNSRFGRS